MINNTAGYAGDHIYGGTLDNCKMYAYCPTDLLHGMFHIFPNKTERSLSAVSSNPRQICFCSDGRPNCSHHTLNYSRPVYPGRSITVDVIGVGQFEGTVPSIILVSSLFPLHKLQSQITDIGVLQFQPWSLLSTPWPLFNYRWSRTLTWRMPHI